MNEQDRLAFRRGYRDYEVYVEQKRLGIARLFDSRYTLPWAPPAGYEDAYAAGWHTARERRRAGEDARLRTAAA